MLGSWSVSKQYAVRRVKEGSRRGLAIGGPISHGRAMTARITVAGLALLLGAVAVWSWFDGAGGAEANAGGAYRLFAPGAASASTWRTAFVRDPDEPGVLRNDIVYMLVTASEASVNVTLYPASPFGFTFMDGVAEPAGGVVVWFRALPWVDYVFEAPGITATIDGPAVHLVAWRHGVAEPDAVMDVAWRQSGNGITFVVPAHWFGGADEFQLLAAGSDTDGIFAYCTWDSCADEAVDWVPGTGHDMPTFYFPGAAGPLPPVTPVP
jgi:hypothetical protein